MKTRQELIEEQLLLTTGYTHYNGWHNGRTDYGYHSFNIDDIQIRGQRIPKQRLDKMKNFITFEDKNVIDFGCNVGGMLLHIPEIKNGLGFDYDKKCIDAANNIKLILNNNNTNFIQFDLDKGDYNILKDLITFKPDIIFLLAVGSWVSNIEKLFDFCIDYNCDIILETNNSKYEKHHLKYFSEKGYKNILISNTSDDDIRKENYGRHTYLIQK